MAVHPEQQDQRIKDIKEISLAIDSWDDVFSDFDPRPLSERALSEDFIAELRKRYRESRRGTFLITMFAPIAMKDEKTVKSVIQRLKSHFKHRALQSRSQIAGIRARGVIFVAAGILSLGFLTLITYYKSFSVLAIELSGIVLMPLGWFGVWEGFSKIVDTSSTVIQEEKLFNKLSKAAYRVNYLEPGK
ncbi:MAG: hypothetical protein ABIJ27_02210 [Candidatus Omnitrophota bacterium]